MTDLSREAQIARAQKYIQRQLTYAQRQINQSQRGIQQFSKYNCDYSKQKSMCEEHRQQKPEQCKTCIVWELEQFKKIKLYINEGKINLE